MNPIVYIGVILSLLSGAVIDLVSGDNAQLDTDSLIVDSGLSSFQEDRQTDADNVNNTVTNMLNGDVKASSAKDYISDERFYAKKCVDGNAVETEVNGRYIDYLNAAMDVVTAYSVNSPVLSDAVEIMNQKKNAI